MIDNQISIDFRFVDKEELLQRNECISHFESPINYENVQVDYKYKEGPNNNRIQLELSGEINGKNIIDYYGLNRNIEFPFQYPKHFELLNQQRGFVAIPHNKGVYILHIDSNIKHLVKYQTDRFQTCFFVDTLFIIVEDKGLKVVNVADFTENSILFEDDKRIFINAIQIQGNQIYAIIQDVNVHRMKLFVFDRSNLSIDNYDEYNLADLIVPNTLMENLRYEKESELAVIPDFKYNSCIDSWRFTANHTWNSLIGRLEYWLQPVKDGEYYIRKEKYDFIELKIKMLQKLANNNEFQQS